MPHYWFLGGFFKFYCYGIFEFDGLVAGHGVSVPIPGLGGWSSGIVVQCRDTRLQSIVDADRNYTIW